MYGVCVRVYARVRVCVCGGGGAVVWIAQDMMSNRLKQRINSDDFCAMLVNNIVDVYGFLEVPQKQNMRRITRNGPRVCLARAVHAALWVMRIAVVQDSRHACCMCMTPQHTHIAAGV